MVQLTHYTKHGKTRKSSSEYSFDAMLPLFGEIEHNGVKERPYQTNGLGIQPVYVPLHLLYVTIKKYKHTTDTNRSEESRHRSSVCLTINVKTTQNKVKQANPQLIISTYTLAWCFVVQLTRYTKHSKTRKFSIEYSSDAMLPRFGEIEYNGAKGRPYQTNGVGIQPVCI